MIERTNHNYLPSAAAIACEEGDIYYVLFAYKIGDETDSNLSTEDFFYQYRFESDRIDKFVFDLLELDIFGFKDDWENFGYYGDEEF